MRAIRVGARRSPLAVAQAEWIADRIERAGYPVEVVGIDSLGDRDRRRLTEIGGTGIFATAVRDLLHADAIDVAVHSLKDLPVAPAPGLLVAAIPQREDVRDVLVGAGIDQWRDGIRVGTGSPRRAVQVHALAAERGVKVNVVPIRGNVDTRLGLVADGEVDATLLAAAGLLRLGRLESTDSGIEQDQDVTVAGRPARLLAVERMLPAAGQGALAVECRAGASDDLLHALASIDDVHTRAAVTAERRFLSTLEAGCLAPVGALARVEDQTITLRAVVGPQAPEDPDAPADRLHRVSGTGSVQRPDELGESLALELLPQLSEQDPAVADRVDGMP